MSTREGQKLTLNKLYAAVRKKRGRAKILVSIVVGIGQMSNGEQVQLGYIMLSLESRCGQDPRTIGNLFYICCDELQDISLVEALQRIPSLLEQFLEEQLQLAEAEIRKLIN